MVKDHAQQTQRRLNVFASQCADREYKSAVYGHAYNDITHLLGAQNKKMSHVGTVGTLYCSQHIVTFMIGNFDRGGSVSVKRKDKTKDEVNMAINNIFKYALKAYACSHKFMTHFK